MKDFDETEINRFYLELFKQMNPNVVSNQRYTFKMFDKLDGGTQMYVEIYKDGVLCGTTYSDEMLAFHAISSSRKQKNVESSILQDRIKEFYSILDQKNSWGKNEVKQRLLEVLSGV